MLPILADLSFLKIYTFGVFLVLAFFWGSFLLWKNISLTSYKEEDIFDGVFFSLFGALFLGRVVYVAFHFDKFGFNPIKFLLINGYPGLSLIGCLAGGLLVFWLYCLTHKIRFSEIIDYSTAPLLLSLGIGKLGSFFSGAEIGTKTTFPISLKYVNVDGFRHITAFYESALFFIAAFISYKLLFSIRRGNLKRGFSLYFFGWYFGLVYGILDFLKASKMYIAGYSFNQIVAALLLLTCTLYIIYYGKVSIGEAFKSIKNSFIDHGTTTFKKIHRGSAKKTSRGENKD